MATGNSINLNASGMTAYDGAGTFFGRTLLSSTAQLTITNPDGVAGNPSFAISGFTTWSEVTGTSQAIAVNNGYIANNASLITFTLPASAAIGDMIQIIGKGAGGWKIAQNASQQINLGILPTTVGVAGSLASTKQFDCIELRCITAGSSTIWVVNKSIGNITVV